MSAEHPAAQDRYCEPGGPCEVECVDGCQDRSAAAPSPHVVFGLEGPCEIRSLPHDTEQEDLRLGFAECWRVLAPGGTLVFKWADKFARVEPHFPTVPIVGTRSPRGGQTRWFIFYKPLNAANLEAVT